MPIAVPTTMPTTRTALRRCSGTCQARALATMRTRASARPDVAMPTRPNPVASHRVLLGCANATSICSASRPVTPVDLMKV